MRRRIIGGWITSLLLILTTAGAGAQSPEPTSDGPPWFGGRVEMPEHGFAVTVPEGWVGMAPDADVASQWQVVDETWGAASTWGPDPVTMPGPLAILAGPGIRPAAWQRCTLAPREDDYDYGGSDVANEFTSRQNFEPEFVELESRSVDLDAGRTMVHDISGYDLVHAAVYVIGQDDGLVMLCISYGQRPDDDWLSIAETVEFLPPEE